MGFTAGLLIGGDNAGQSGITSSKYGTGLLTGLIVGGICSLIGGAIGLTSPTFEEIKLRNIQYSNKKKDIINFLRKQNK